MLPVGLLARQSHAYQERSVSHVSGVGRHGSVVRDVAAEVGAGSAMRPGLSLPWGSPRKRRSSDARQPSGSSVRDTAGTEQFALG
jgi:hypothetical protein